MRSYQHVLIAAALVAGPLQAQTSPMYVGAGLTLARSEWLQGDGTEVMAHGRLASRGMFALRGHARFDAAQLDGAPFVCEMVRDVYCFGRTDQTRSLALGFGAVIDRDRARKHAFYAIPLELGVIHMRARSSELEGPTTNCIENGQLVSCPDNPPFATHTRRFNRTGASVGAGLGYRRNVAGISALIEGRIAASSAENRGTTATIAMMAWRAR